MKSEVHLQYGEPDAPAGTSVHPEAPAATGTPAATETVNVKSEGLRISSLFNWPESGNVLNVISGRRVSLSHLALPQNRATSSSSDATLPVCA